MYPILEHLLANGALLYLLLITDADNYIGYYKMK